MYKKVLIGMVAMLVVGGAIMLTTRPDSNTTTGQDSGSQVSGNEQATENEVFIDNFAFGPESLVVKKGTTVTWTNKDSARHNVDFTDAQLENSRLLAQGESFTYTFNEVGVFDYTCTPHPYMQATIEVIE